MTETQIGHMIDGVMARHVEKPSRTQLLDACRGRFGEIRSRAMVRRAFVYDLMCDVIVKGRTRSVNDVFTDKASLMEIFDVLNRNFEKVTGEVEDFESRDNADPFEMGKRMYMHLMDGVRMFSSTFKCAMPTDFPYERCRELIHKYSTNGVMYDPSCGWGSRMSAAIAEGVSYIGTDPNDMLVPRLREMAEAMNTALYGEALWDDEFIDVRIECQGSETFIPELKGRCGLILTSPPYFDLEDYIYGEQSIKKFREYDAWCEGFLRATLRNCYEYLTDDGNCIFNVKNYGNVRLRDDLIRIAGEVGFRVAGTEPLENIQRFTNNEEHLLDNDEDCVVFRKD